MSKSKIFVILVLGFSLGILLASVFKIENRWLFLAAAFLVCFYGIFWQSKYSIVLLFLLTCIFGCYRFNIYQNVNEFDSWYGTKQSFEAVVVGDIDVRSDKQLITVRPEGYKQNILVTSPLSKKFFYGDKVWIEGKITEAKSFDDFDYKGYLEKQNVYALSYYPKMITLKENQANFFVYKLLQVKYWFIGQLSEKMPEPYAALLLGILIGARKSLPDDIYQNFLTTGTSHIIAISGFNISVIVGAVAFLPYYLGRRVSLVVTILIILAFVVISGASASVIRASIMGGLLLVSLSSGRLYAITQALSFSALVMLLFNPKILFWDVGFQLSFLATAGIVYIVPPLEILTKNWPKFFGAKATLFTTLAAIISTLPLTLFQFGRLSTVAVVVNLLVLPLVPPAMLFGFLSFVPIAGTGFAFIGYCLLWLILKIVGFFASLPHAVLDIKISAVWLFLAYGLIFCLVFLLNKAAKKHVQMQFDKR